MATNNGPQLSIVIPAYNEAESLPVLLQQIRSVIETHAYTAEVIFVNDGSTDGTYEVLEQLKSEQDSDTLQVHVIHFRRNQGKAAGLMAGFAAAHGEIVITMDADLQDDPQEIPKLLDALKTQNADLISGWKYPRKDPFEKRMFSFVFNRVTAMFTGVKLHDMNCGFKAYRAEVIKELHLYGDLHRYIPILANTVGFSVGEVKVKHHPRRFGVSKYGFKRIPKGFFDLLTVLFLTRYRKRPMHFLGGARKSLCVQRHRCVCSNCCFIFFSCDTTSCYLFLVFRRILYCNRYPALCRWVFGRINRRFSRAEE